MKNIGLYFGSFNPIHIGHLIIANHIVNHYSIDELWFVVSPQNPFKQNQTLADQEDRAKMVSMAIQNNRKLKLSKIEFDLPKPSFTIDTLYFLKNHFPKNNFHIIMGEDNVMKLHLWKSFKEIINNYPIFIYPRITNKRKIAEFSLDQLPNEIKNGQFTIVNSPIIEISSTAIRKAIVKGNDISFLTTNDVIQYISYNKLYS